MNVEVFGNYLRPDKGAVGGGFSKCGALLGFRCGCDRSHTYIKMSKYRDWENRVLECFSYFSRDSFLGPRLPFGASGSCNATRFVLSTISAAVVVPCGLPFITSSTRATSVACGAS